MIVYDEKLGEMTYAEWKEAKAHSKDILAQEIVGKEKKKEYVDEYKKIGKDKITNTGARILNPLGKYERKWARSYYEEIRHKTTDCKKIAKRLGMSEEEIVKIKEYIFNGTWYNELTKEYEQFTPDAAIAQSWQRLAEGEIKPHDITLIKHEMYEMELKEKYPNISHIEAHSLAEIQYNYQAESEEYYDNLVKAKKDRK